RRGRPPRRPRPPPPRGGGGRTRGGGAARAPASPPPPPRGGAGPGGRARGTGRPPPRPGAAGGARARGRRGRGGQRGGRAPVAPAVALDLEAVAGSHLAVEFQGRAALVTAGDAAERGLAPVEQLVACLGAAGLDEDAWQRPGARLYAFPAAAVPLLVD